MIASSDQKINSTAIHAATWASGGRVSSCGFISIIYFYFIPWAPRAKEHVEPLAAVVPVDAFAVEFQIFAAHPVDHDPIELVFNFFALREVVDGALDGQYTKARLYLLAGKNKIVVPLNGVAARAAQSGDAAGAIKRVDS